VRDDPWLAQRLGRAALWWQDGDDPGRVAAAARERAPALAQARVPADAVATLGELQDAGFRVVDATVTMAGRPAQAAAGDGIVIRDAVAPDAAALLEIAERHYGVSRFHLDPAIADDVAGAIKRSWLQAYLDGERGERLLAADREGRAAGFLALLRRGDGVGIIDLVAVHPQLRGTGAGTALVGALAPAFERIEAGTQLANTGALRFYASLGFTVAATAYVLHLHA
jgi:ribosomal protein S18 acetylase RimI-like enzyme